MSRSGGGGEADQGSETCASRADQWFGRSRWGELLQRPKCPLSRQKHETWCYACGSEIAWWSKYPRHLPGVWWHTTSHVIRCVWELWLRSSAFDRGGRGFNTKRGKAERAAEPGASKEGVLGDCWPFHQIELLPLGRNAGVPGDLPRCSARELRRSSCTLPRSGLPLLLHGPNQFGLVCVLRDEGNRGHNSGHEARPRPTGRCRREIMVRVVITAQVVPHPFSSLSFCRGLRLPRCDDSDVWHSRLPMGCRFVVASCLAAVGLLLVHRRLSVRENSERSQCCPWKDFWTQGRVSERGRSYSRWPHHSFWGEDSPRQALCQFLAGQVRIGVGCLGAEKSWRAPQCRCGLFAGRLKAFWYPWPDSNSWELARCLLVHTFVWRRKAMGVPVVDALGPKHWGGCGERCRARSVLLSPYERKR